MKKVLFILLFVSCLLFTTACSNENAAEKETLPEDNSLAENTIRYIHFDEKEKKALGYFMLDESNANAYEYSASEDFEKMDIVHAVYQDGELVSEEKIDTVVFEKRGGGTGVIAVESDNEDKICNLTWLSGDGKSKSFFDSIKMTASEEGFTYSMASKLFTDKEIKEEIKYPIVKSALSKESGDDAEITFDSVTIEGYKIDVIYVTFS